MPGLRLTIHLTRWYLLPISTFNAWSARTYAWLCFTLDMADHDCERWL